MPIKSKIEREVDTLLQQAGVKEAPVPVERIARLCGAQVRYAPFEGDISGLLYRESNVTIIGVNSLHAPSRRRFTIAHEIGHLVLKHAEIKSEALHVDRKFVLLHRDSRSSQAVDENEMSANAFAASLLMPRETLTHDFEVFRKDTMAYVDCEDGELASSLADLYKVSLQSMLIRLTKLQLLPK